MAREMTAGERAADDMYTRLISVMRLPEHEHHAKARLELFYQVVRQEALREAVECIKQREQYYEKKEAESEGAMRMTRGLQRNEASGCIDAIDRLASEGG